MIEFGARLSLRDNMSATLQRNLNTQRRFSEQVDRTRSSVTRLGNTRANPTINARDKATSIVDRVRENLKTVSKTVANPFIQVKDKATSVLNKTKNTLKTIGKTVAKPFVAVKDRASPIIEKVKNGLKTVGNAVAKPLVAIKDSATAGLSEIKSMLGTLAKGVTIAVATAGVAGLTASLSEGAKLQQSTGGVETLYGDSAGNVKANAEMAYKTAGLSANAYMEQVTSFSASLISSLGGDTAKASSVANTAIIDMADNANKFGTDMESIQNAYQGFAKSNYTMLDNLKLGYGGTQEEMMRLLSDAQKLTGVKYNIDNLSDVYNAIHAVQENLGIAGATADEAEKTFSGSFASMKASAQNMLGALSTGGDIKGAMTALVDSASTFLFDNAIPMVGNVITALPSAISTGIKKIAPKLAGMGRDIANSLRDGLKTMLPSSMSGAIDGAFDGIGNIVSTLTPVVEKLGGMFKKVFPQILGAVTSTIPLINPIIEYMSSYWSAMIPVVGGVISTFSQTIQQVMPIVAQVFSAVSATVTPIIQQIASLIQSAMPIVSTVISTAVNVISAIMPTLTSIFQKIGAKVQEIVGVVQKHMPLIQTIFETVCGAIEVALPVVQDVITGAWDVISPIIDLAIQIFDKLLSCVEKVFPTIQSIVESVWGALEPIFDGIAGGLSKVGDAVSGVAEFAGDGIDTVASWFGFAYGKDRVPYDNYPAILHAGEKVLTRNQADQYDRQMSTRGVQLAKVEPVTTGGSGGNAGDYTVLSTEKQIHNTTQNIDIHVYNPVIQKEADVDDVVEEMITKFRKLAPNMA